MRHAAEEASVVLITPLAKAIVGDCSLAIPMASQHTLFPLLLIVTIRFRALLQVFVVMDRLSIVVAGGVRCMVVAMYSSLTCRLPRVLITSC